MKRVTSRRVATTPLAAALPPRVAEVPQDVCLLAGHSGAQLTLHRHGRVSIVRKRAATPAGNLRLLQQAEKQRQLRAHGLPFPRVTESGTDASGIAYFEMDYVPAYTLASAIQTAGAYDVGTVVAAIERMFWLFRQNIGAPIPSTVFAHKIDEVVGKCATHPSTAAFAQKIASLGGALHKQSWSNIPSSPGHGDLTLENILLSPAQGIVFIDCDETFASSFWLDAGKLFQDIDGHWCLRALLSGGPRDAGALNAIQKLERLGVALRHDLQAADPSLPAYLPQLAALGLLRTLPYARDGQTVSFVIAQIARVLNLPS